MVYETSFLVTVTKNNLILKEDTYIHIKYCFKQLIFLLSIKKIVTISQRLEIKVLVSILDFKTNYSLQLFMFHNIIYDSHKTIEKKKFVHKICDFCSRT